MLNYAVYMQVSQKLLGLSSLTKELSIPGNFYRAAIEYLTEFQAIADTHYLYISSDIASILNKVISFGFQKNKVSGSARHNFRKDCDVYAVNCVEDFHKTIKAFLEKDSTSIEECRNVWRQVVSRALAKGYEEVFSSAKDRVDTIISIVKADNELSPYYAHIIGLAGVINARAILDTILPQLGL